MPAKRLSFAIIATRCAAKKVPAKARLPSARAACLRSAQTNRHVPPCAVSETSQTARELSAPVGGRALGLRSEYGWLAAELLSAGLEPGAVERRALWTGLCPSSPSCPLPKVRPALAPPARPACAAARARAPALPVPARPGPSFCPISQPRVCPESRRSRRELSNKVLYVFWVAFFV